MPFQDYPLSRKNDESKVFRLQRSNWVVGVPTQKRPYPDLDI